MSDVKKHRINLVGGYVAIEPDKLRERLTPEVITQLLCYNWASHDARWYLKVGLECGFAVANKLNKDAIRSIGRTEIKRLLEATQSSEIKTAEDFINIQKIACEVYFPPPMGQLWALAHQKGSWLRGPSHLKI